MSFLLDTLEETLHLSDDDKATVNAALPTLHRWMYLLNQQWDTLADAVGWLAGSKQVVLNLLDNGRTLGPIAEEVLGGGGNIFETGTAYSVVNDAKTTINAHPKLVAALTADYYKLAPLIAQVQNDLYKPEVKACVLLIQAKMGQHNMPVHVVASRLIGGASMRAI